MSIVTDLVSLIELILHDTSFAIVILAYSQSLHDWVIIYCTTFVNASAD